MALLVFKIIFLCIFLIGALITLCAKFFYPQKKEQAEAVRFRKITRLRLIGIVIGLVGLLVVLILGYFN